MGKAPAQYEYLRSHLHEIARRIADRLVEEIPVYRALPAEVVDTDIVRIIESNMRLFLDVIAKGRDPTEDELRHIAASAAQRAQERLPLDALLAGTHLGIEVGWWTVVEATPPEDLHDLLDASRHLLRHLRATVPVIAMSYLQEHQTIHGDERDARLALVNALLAGEPTSQLAARAGVRPAPSYLVVHLRLLSNGDQDLVVSEHRTARLIQAELDGCARTTVLTAFDQHGATILYPARPETLAALTADMPALVTRVGELTRHRCTAGIAPARESGDVPVAARQALEIADLALRLGRPPGTYQLGDLLFEYQITRPGPGLEMMAAVLEPLGQHEHLLDSLRVLIDTDSNRRLAAARLHIHPNTLDYRMRRIAVLTGLDPHQPQGSHQLRAALLAHDLLRTG
jgi:hypothetical protein